MIFTARKRSLGQDNVFTPVCHSVHREGVSVPACTTGQMTREVSVQVGSLSGVSVQGVSVQVGFLSRGVCLGGSLSRVSLCGGVSVQGWGLCPGVGSLSKGSLSGRSLSRGGVPVQGWSLCPGVGSLSRGRVSVQGWDLCPGLGSLSRAGVSVQGGLCPGGSLSREISVQGGICPGGSLSGSPRTLTSGRYASYSSAFLSGMKFHFDAVHNIYLKFISYNYQERITIYPVNFPRKIQINNPHATIIILYFWQVVFVVFFHLQKWILRHNNHG